MGAHRLHTPNLFTTIPNGFMYISEGFINETNMVYGFPIKFFIWALVLEPGNGDGDRRRGMADSEIRTHDGALQDEFSEQNRPWDDSGTVTSET